MAQQLRKDGAHCAPFSPSAGSTILVRDRIEGAIELSAVGEPEFRWRAVDPREAGFRREILAEMVRTIRRNRYPIDSITVARGGRLALDLAFHPHRKGHPHKLYSCTKTLVGVLIGTAVDRGLIADLDAPLVDLFPEFADRFHGGREAITLEQVLTMTWGVRTRDDGDRWVGFEGDTPGGLLGRIFDSPVRAPAGAVFAYNNSCSHVLCCLLRRATGRTPAAFAQEVLFDPLGIRQVSWDDDAQAGNTGWSGLQLSARDLAKVGQLYLNGGEWEGRRLLSRDWIERSTAPHAPAQPHGAYGYHWWVTPDYYMAAGIFGQFLFVAPDQQLVVVANSTLPSGDTNLPKHIMEQYILGPLKHGSSPAVAPRPTVRGSRSYLTPRFVWRTEAEGVCEQGRFVRTAAPAFSFECPPRARQASLNGRFQVAALKTADEFPLYASVADIPDGVALSEIGHYFAARAQSATISNVRVVSNRPIELAGGHAAYRTELTYRWRPEIAMKAIVVSTFVRERWVFVDGHTPLDLADLVRTAESLSIIG